MTRGRWFRDIPQSRFAGGFRDVAASRFGGGFRAVAGPAGPAAIAAWSAVPGGAAGTVSLTITTLGAAGDGAVKGDGLGVITGLQYQYEGAFPWVSLGATAPGNWTLAWHLVPGESLRLRVRALGTGGRAGVPSAFQMVTVAGDAVNAVAIYDSSGLLTEGGLYIMQFAKTPPPLVGADGSALLGHDTLPLQGEAAA